MKRKIWIRAAATATALGLVAGAVAFAATGTTTTPNRPVRALGANGDAALGTASGEGGASAAPVAGTVAMPHRTASLAALPQRPPTRVPWVKRELRLEGKEEVGGDEARPALGSSTTLDQADDALQPGPRGGQIPPPDLNVAGLGSAANPFKLVPPDTNGDVGAGFFLQMVNVAFAVYDADDGTKLLGPVFMSSLFDDGSQKLCATHDDGDPIVVYDETADRFVLSQFALNFATNTYYECIAVSQDGSPSDGAWHAYQFQYPIQALNDYPKFGVWPDGYYASFNQFRLTNQGNFVWRGAGAIAYERSAMLVGDPATQIYADLFQVREDLGGLLPSDWDSPDAPPAGMPNLYAMFDADDAFWGYSDDQVELWAFHADFAVPGNSTFTQLDLSNNPENGVDVGNFNPWVCGAPKLACIPQKNSSVKLDAISDRLMNRLQYWNDGATQHLVVNHTVKSNDGGSAVRWYDLENATQNPASTAWGVGDQGTFGPGTLSRWMGSAAMNDQGDLAVGYSTSSKRKFPGIGVAARRAVDPAQTLGAERKFFTGNGSERGNFNRWGDYSAMAVDPADHCTFWYTQQFYSRTGQWRWATRIQPFTVPSCV